MDTTLRRLGDVPVSQPLRQGTVRQLLSAVLHATLNRLPLPRRGLTDEFFRFPMP